MATFLDHSTLLPRHATSFREEGAGRHLAATIFNSAGCRSILQQAQLPL
jgi:hypothetical protein